jgi:hypothetical protein
MDEKGFFDVPTLENKFYNPKVMIVSPNPGSALAG